MTIFSTRRSRWEFTILLLLAISTTLVFWYTDLDIKAAAWFYHPEQVNDAWPERHWWLSRALFDYASPLILTMVIASLGIIALSYRYHFCKNYRRKAWYIILVIALGPGLLVNLVLKDHWGRPRPIHIHEFTGEHQYIPPLQLGHTPDKSFVCGHCSVGYSFFSFYFLAKHYRLAWFAFTLSFGWLMGYTRMLAGAHFLSDILWSGYIVFLVAYLLYYGWYVRVDFDK